MNPPRYATLVCASTPSGAIGKNGTTPWEAMGIATTSASRRFLELTADEPSFGVCNTLVVGRKTYDSLKGKELTGRRLCVLTRAIISPMDRFLTNSPKYAALDSSAPRGRVFIVGGAQTFAACMPYVDVVHQTVVHMEAPDCDAFLPKNMFEGFDGPFPSSCVGVVEATGMQCTFHVWYRNASSIAFAPTVPRHEEHQYLDLVRRILTEGVVKMDRTGTGTRSLFGTSLRFSLRNGTLPLLTTKHVSFSTIAKELLWFISGDTSSKTLARQGVKIWDANGSRVALDRIGLKDREEGDLGPVYGFQWRHAGAEYTVHDADYAGKGVDQLAQVVKMLKRDQDSRRILMSAWNPVDLPKMALPPCHNLVQFYVRPGVAGGKARLSSQMYQRSADMGLGVPYNIASYALLTHLLAYVCNLEADEFIHVMGDCHVYLNHVEPLQTQLTRVPMPFPTVAVLGAPGPSDVNYGDARLAIDAVGIDDLKLSGYESHPAIAMAMSV